MYLEFSISGGDLKLREGTPASYQGTWSGGPITFSGNMIVNRSAGGKSFVTMGASLADQSVKWPPEGEDSAVSGRTVSLPFNFTYNVPADYTGSSISGSARVEACGGVCGSYMVDFWLDLPTSEAPGDPAVTVEAEPSPTTKVDRIITIQGTINVLDPGTSQNWQPGASSLVKPIIEVPVTLTRGEKLMDFTFSKPPDGSFQFQVPLTDSLVLSATLLHAVSVPSTFRVVYDQADPTIWIATTPFSLDENTPDTLVKNINLSDLGNLVSGPVPVPPDRIDDVGLIYHYAREAWQMAAILLGAEFDFPTLKIRAFSTTPRVQDSAYWDGPMTGFAPVDPTVELSPKLSDFTRLDAGGTVTHEFGHHVMADIYGNFMPYSPGDTNHEGFANPSTTDSWVEGFATFFALWTQKDQVMATSPQLWHNQGDVENLELNYLAWSADEEYAVTSLLWDLIDPVSAGDATEMPVANWATQPVVTTTTATKSYGDHIQLDRSLIWQLLADATLASFDRPPAAPQGYDYIFDVKQLYETLQANGVGLLLPATPNGLDAVDELFIAHGFFADTNPQNLAWDVGEEIGVTNNQPITVGKVNFPARSVRRSPPRTANTYFNYQALDAVTDGAVDVVDFLVTVQFEPPYEEYNYSYTTRAVEPGRLQYAGPPGYYRATTSIAATGPNVEASAPLQFTNEQYWQMRSQSPSGALMDHTFEVQTSGGMGLDDIWSGGIQGGSGGIVPEFSGNLLLPLLCCGGVAIFLVVGLVLVLGARSRKKRQAPPSSPSPASIPGSAPTSPPAQPDRYASSGGWQLVVVDGPDTGQRYSLGHQNRLGRSSDNDIQIRDEQSSRRHAVVQQQVNGYVISDLGSRNGTFVNGTRIDRPTWLQNRDTIQVGKTILRVIAHQAVPQVGEAPAPTPAPVPVTSSPAPAAYRPAPAQAPAAEAVVGVIPNIERRKGMFGADAYNLVLTLQHLVFARLTSEMLKAATEQARQDAKAQGKGFFGQWGAQMGASGDIVQRYYQMPVEAILREHPDNFVIPVSQVRKVRFSQGDIEVSKSDQMTIEAAEKMRFNLKGSSIGETKKMLRQVLGTRVK
jgi:pSer/pThr/pTyr-binding forkhead associated (FHA) protein